MSKKFKYVRIQGRELVKNTMTGRGVFSMCMEMLRNDEMEEEDADLFRELDSWFSENLPWPPQCKNQESVVCYFKTENADEMMKMMGPIMWLLDRYNHPYYVVYTNNPGEEIVYEDQYQVVVRVSGKLEIAEIPLSWSPEDE